MTIFNNIFCGLDTIHITITRPRSAIAFYGENGEPTDKLFYGILDILIGKSFIVLGGSKKYVNNGIEYIQSNSKEILIQLRSTHIMKNGSSKVDSIIKFLHNNGVKPKAKRNRKKTAIKEAPINIFYQITRLDFARDFETNFDLVKILNENVGYSRFFIGIPKNYSYRVIHDNNRLPDGKREHKIKEFKIFNKGFELAIYNKKIEIIEQANEEKFKLYTDIYHEVIKNKQRHIFRVELRFFRSRSISFNHLTAEEIFNLPKQELIKFGKTIRLLKNKNNNAIESLLFSKLFAFSESI